MNQCQHQTITVYISNLHKLTALSSVASVAHGHGQISHAMVLDTFDQENNTFIFKNTFDHEGKTKQVKIKRTDSNLPKEFYFVHIQIKDMENLPDQDEREALKKQK